MIDTQSPLENLAACAIAYLAGILFTLVVLGYVDAAVASKRDRDSDHRRHGSPSPNSNPDPDPHNPPNSVAAPTTQLPVPTGAWVVGSQQPGINDWEADEDEEDDEDQGPDGDQDHRHFGPFAALNAHRTSSRSHASSRYTHVPGERCPHCGSTRIAPCHLARRIGSAIGTLAGAATATTRVAGGAQLGAQLGALLTVPAGPPGVTFGVAAGAVLGAMVGAAAGGAVGAALGEAIDAKILHNHHCIACKRAFSVDMA